MIYKRFKCSAIHNLLITNSSETETLNEGIVIPKRIMEIVDIYNGQEIILTRVGAGNWKNRIRTFVIEGQDDNKVEIRGSLTKFLEKGDLTCIITEAYLNESELDEYNNQEFSIFDLGFDPQTNTDNSVCTLDLQYANKKHRNIDIKSQEFKEQKEKRAIGFSTGGVYILWKFLYSVKSAKKRNRLMCSMLWILIPIERSQN